MDKTPAAEAQKKLDAMTSQGLILVHYFYEGLRPLNTSRRE